MKITKNNFMVFNKNTQMQIIPTFIFTLLLLLVSVNAKAQTSRPTPTPSSEIPKVISRDADSVKTNPIDKDVNEKADTDSANTIKIPRQNTSTSNEDKDFTTKKQKKMMLYLELLTKTEQRSASLQKQLFDLIEKQNTYVTKIKQLEYLLRPEVIASSTALTGTLRPEDLRVQRKQALELEKSNYETLLQKLEARRNVLEISVQKADALVEKIRVRFDAIVDAALTEEDENL